MSNVPGISPITPDFEEVRHSAENGLFGDESYSAVPREESDDDDDDDDEARRVVEGQVRIASL